MVRKGYLAVDPKYDELLASLRTPYAKELQLIENKQVVIIY
jgi:hypothetical protein